MPLHKLRPRTQDQGRAVQVADLLGAPAAPEALAVTMFEHSAAHVGGGGLLC